MTASLPVTETIILHLKDGINLQDAEYGTEDGASLAPQVFHQLNDTIKAQPGFIRQFWGHQVEDPRIFVWYIDWVSFEDVTAFANSTAQASFIAGMRQVFDLEVAPPLIMYTRFTEDAYAALGAPVTEIAFFTVPNDAREEARAMLEEPGTPVSQQTVVTVGKATGGANGFVFETKNADDAAPAGKTIVLHGVYGYATVDDHIRWRQTPECAQVMEGLRKSRLGKMGLGNSILPGGFIFAPETSMFHVNFRGGL